MEGNEVMNDCNPVVVGHTARLVQLEGVQDSHTIALKDLNQMLKEFTKVKYAIYGGVALYVVQSIGLAEVFKRML